MDTSRRPIQWLILLLAVVAPLLARAEGDPPGRVGRLAELQGHVWLYDPDQGDWIEADRNRPLTTGDRLATDGDARAELRVGSTTLRLGAGSELEVLRLDDQRLSFQLHHGELALRVRSREVAAETDLVTDEVQMQPLRSGHYRIDRIDDSTYAGSWRGSLRVGEGAEAFTLEPGQRVEVWRDGVRGALQSQGDAMPRDDFGAWVASADANDERSAANRFVSPEMTGAEDLDANGRWEQAPDVGPVWVPSGVDADWAPYRFGHWAWVAPWGWTWIDDASWGFAPFHYGRWLQFGGRWCWSPGTYDRRPVYAPALVAWVGGAGFNVSIRVGGPLLPAVGWVPLAPREAFVPYFRASIGYEERVNDRTRGAPPPRRLGVYANQSVAGAVTVVPREVIERRRPVAPGRVKGVIPPRFDRPERGFAPVPAPARPQAEPRAEGRAEARRVPPPPVSRGDWRRPLPVTAPGAGAPPYDTRRPGREPRPLQQPTPPAPQPQQGQPQQPLQTQQPLQPQPQQPPSAQPPETPPHFDGRRPLPDREDRDAPPGDRLPNRAPDRRPDRGSDRPAAPPAPMAPVQRPEPTRPAPERQAPERVPDRGRPDAPGRDRAPPRAERAPGPVLVPAQPAAPAPAARPVPPPPPPPPPPPAPAPPQQPAAKPSPPPEAAKPAPEAAKPAREERRRRPPEPGDKPGVRE